MENETLIEADKLTLESWLGLIFSPQSHLLYPPSCCFPSDEILKEYTENIEVYSEVEFKKIIRKFIVHTGALGSDPLTLQGMVTIIKENEVEAGEKIKNLEFFKRLYLWAKNKSPEIFPWEGITWIIDLLPHYPHNAIDIIDSYIFVHGGHLPDYRLRGLWDIQAIIRARYISIPIKKEEDFRKFLLTLKPDEFEYLVCALYNKIGYETELTQQTHDGGKDIICTNKDLGKKEKLLVQCKRYKDTIKVNYVRELLGVVSGDKVNKGVLVASSTFSPDAVKFAKQNPRIELINWKELINLLAENFGNNWHLRIDKMIGHYKGKDIYSKRSGNSA